MTPTFALELWQSSQGHICTGMGHISQHLRTHGVTNNENTTHVSNKAPKLLSQGVLTTMISDPGDTKHLSQIQHSRNSLNLSHLVWGGLRSWASSTAEGT